MTTENLADFNVYFRQEERSGISLLHLQLGRAGVVVMQGVSLKARPAGWQEVLR